MADSHSNTIQIPIIETERLRLRGHRLEDFQDSVALWSDANVTRFIGGQPLTEEDVWARLMRYAGHWAWMGFGYWLLEEKSTGRFAGEAGLADWKRDIEPSIHGIPEAGWVLASRVHGMGYATEAVQAIIAWSEQNIPASKFQPRKTGGHRREVERSGPVLIKDARTVCIIDTGNVRSVRVAEKCGFRELCRTTYHDHPIHLFTR
jgi:RimJ/RimL family protein N-acetyltransferase